MREIASRLERAGLRSRPLSAWGKTPFSNVLLVAERPADALSSSPAAG
jgi:hypothetical protein